MLEPNLYYRKSLFLFCLASTGRIDNRNLFIYLNSSLGLV